MSDQLVGITRGRWSGGNVKIEAALAALKHQERARRAYISLDNVRDGEVIEPNTWAWRTIREMQGWQRDASRKAREHLFALIGEKP